MMMSNNTKHSNSTSTNMKYNNKNYKTQEQSNLIIKEQIRQSLEQQNIKNSLTEAERNFLNNIILTKSSDDSSTSIVNDIHLTNVLNALKNPNLFFLDNNDDEEEYYCPPNRVAKTVGRHEPRRFQQEKKEVMVANNENEVGITTAEKNRVTRDNIVLLSSSYSNADGGRKPLTSIGQGASLSQNRCTVSSKNASTTRSNPIPPSSRRHKRSSITASTYQERRRNDSSVYARLWEAHEHGISTACTNSMTRSIYNSNIMSNRSLTQKSKALATTGISIEESTIQTLRNLVKEDEDNEASTSSSSFRTSNSSSSSSSSSSPLKDNSAKEVSNSVSKGRLVDVVGPQLSPLIEKNSATTLSPSGTTTSATKDTDASSVATGSTSLDVNEDTELYTSTRSCSIETITKNDSNNISRISDYVDEQNDTDISITDFCRHHSYSFESASTVMSSSIRRSSTTRGGLHLANSIHSNMDNESDILIMLEEDDENVSLELPTILRRRDSIRSSLLIPQYMLHRVNAFPATTRTTSDQTRTSSTVVSIDESCHTTLSNNERQPSSSSSGFHPSRIRSSSEESSNTGVLSFMMDASVDDLDIDTSFRFTRLGLGTSSTIGSENLGSIALVPSQIVLLPRNSISKKKFPYPPPRPSRRSSSSSRLSIVSTNKAVVRRNRSMIRLSISEHEPLDNATITLDDDDDDDLSATMDDTITRTNSKTNSTQEHNDNDVHRYLVTRKASMNMYHDEEGFEVMDPLQKSILRQIEGGLLKKQNHQRFANNDDIDVDDEKAIQQLLNESIENNSNDSECPQRLRTLPSLFQSQSDNITSRPSVLELVIAQTSVRSSNDSSLRGSGTSRNSTVRQQRRSSKFDFLMRSSILRGMPFLILGTSSKDIQCLPHVMSPPLMESLQNFIPERICECNFWLKYSLIRDGANLLTLLKHVRGSNDTILSIETVNGNVFGCYTSCKWNKQFGYYGTGETFLWRMRESRSTTTASSILDCAQKESDIDVYNWTGENEMIQLCNTKHIALGGGSITSDNNTSCDNSSNNCGFGLCIDQDLYTGSSYPCATFNNPSLCSSSSSSCDANTFEIANLEVWSFTPCYTIEDAEKLELTKLFLHEHNNTNNQ